MRVAPAVSGPALLFLLAATLPAAAAVHPHHPAPKASTANIRHSSATAPHKAVAAVVVHHDAVAAMAPERAAAIQSALIKQGYLTGEPSGTWDAESATAMQKFQADNDWQTKYTPDARALNKLGLGGAAKSADEVAVAQGEK